MRRSSEPDWGTHLSGGGQVGTCEVDDLLLVVDAEPPIDVTEITLLKTSYLRAFIPLNSSLYYVIQTFEIVDIQKGADNAGTKAL